MSKPLAIRDHIPTDPDFFLRSAAEPRPDGAYGSREEEISRRAAALRDRLEVLEQGCRRLLEAVEQALPDGGAADLDDLVDDLLRVERSLHQAFEREAFLPLAGEVREASALAVEPMPARPADELRDLLGRCLEALRDCRWEMMALRAERARDGHRGSKFEDASALRAHLEQLRA